MFPAREGMPPVKLTWWDGGLLFIGDKGTLMVGCYGLGPRLIPEIKMKEYEQPTPTLDRIAEGSGGHVQDWIRSCKGGKPAGSNFDYSGPLTEMVLMGNLAVRFPQKRLLWDGLNMKVINDEAANDYIQREYRDGWSL